MTRRRWLGSAAVATVVVALGQLEAWWGIEATHRQGPHLVEALLYLVTGAVLLWCRVAPLETLLLIVVASVVEYAAVGSPEGNGVMLPALVAGFAVGRWEERHPSWWGLVLAVVQFTAWSLLDPRNTTAQMSLLSLIWLTPWLVAWLVGALLRSRAQNREQRSARALAEERNRIARELHDVIGHHLSVMTVHASAVRRRLAPAQAVERESLETVERAGREALAEMRRIVGVLREPGTGADRAPAPGLSEVPRLVDQVRAAGLPVVLDVTGSPRALPGGLDLTAYRVIQESLTNTLRHAVNPRGVEVGIAYDADTVCLRVIDTADAPATGMQASHGLLGMRERILVYGGELVARPRDGGGFEVVATLPLELT